MLWFRSGVVVSAIITLLIAIIVLTSVFIMCVNPSNGRAMNTDPYYNGTLAFYIVIIFAEVLMCLSSSFGLILAFRIWRNNNQLDHKLRSLFSLWLAALCTATFINFILGILGIVRYREPHEEVTSLFEIFARYNQDPKFVGSFERYQRENSCCGINGPDDWVSAQFKAGGGTGSAGGMMGGYGAGGGGYDGAMGSPSTGKCHLTPPTIPMGCGKKLLEDIHWTQTCYSAVLIIETLTGAATASLGWYCFFYWIEKEVIIIPEDEVSNLIVIEPESSTSTVYTTVTDTSAMADWSRSHYSVDGTAYSNYSRPSQSHYSESRGQNYSRISGSRRPSANPYPSRNSYPSRSYREKGYSAENGSFQPNTPRSSKNSKFSNFYGAVPSTGGPHSAYLSMKMIDPNDVEINQNSIPRSISESVRQTAAAAANPNESLRLHQGSGRSMAYAHSHNQRYRSQHHRESRIPEEQHGTRNNSYFSGNKPFGTSTSGVYENHGARFSESRGSHLARERAHHVPREKPTKKMKKKHSFNHMLHKQEKALGGKVMAEMHIDHSRDPQPMNSNLSTSHVQKGHRAHHATIALVKNKKPPKAQELFHGHEKGHGQTGHLATDILAMSGGAGAVKSLIDDINLPVEHNASLTHGKYLKKLRKQKKELDHPDKDHSGHGPIHKGKDGLVAAPSADGSQAQLILDDLLTTAAHEPPPKEDSKEIVKVHEVVEPGEQHHHHHHGHHHPSLLSTESRRSHRHHHEHDYNEHRPGQSNHHHHHRDEDDNHTLHAHHHHHNEDDDHTLLNAHHHHHHEHDHHKSHHHHEHGHHNSHHEHDHHNSHHHHHHHRNHHGSGHHHHHEHHHEHRPPSFGAYSQFTGAFNPQYSHPSTEILFKSPRAMD